ncbi:6-phosphofructo-2-kinase/fructose-2, 6-bisphosphatase [Gryllus bimaculatus]|nr:6-phosphofructo-2-kinase/fructose-2, 6-bisphosphatase [Gryllus bimaculatus]
MMKRSSSCSTCGGCAKQDGARRSTRRPMGVNSEQQRGMAAGRGGALAATAPLLVATVGLPARSKTTLAHRLARFLAWNGELAEAFTVSDYRRKLMERYDNHNLFRADNSAALEIRNRSAALALADAVEWLRSSGTVAVLDGTHATRAARRQLQERVVDRLGWRLLFVECVVDDDAILERNIQEILHNSPDYRDMGREKAEDDFRKKIAHYLEQYEPVAAKSEGISVVRYCNDGESVTSHRLSGHLEAQVLSFLASFRPCPKTLYFSRHGESEYNVLGRIGGDANLSPRGQAYARALAQRVTEMHLPSLHVWTSQLCRTKQTAQGIKVPVEHLAALNELDAGVCEGLTYEEIQERFPQEFAWRDQDKLRYRYPWGESYIDIMARIQSVLLDLEGADEEVLVVSHQAVLRCVLGYFLHKLPEELPYLDVPLHTLIKLTSDGYNFNIEFIKLPIECVDTYRRQPSNCATDRTTQDALLTVPSHFDSLSLWDSKDMPKSLPIYIEQH